MSGRKISRGGCVDQIGMKCLLTEAYKPFAHYYSVDFYDFRMPVE